MLTPNVFASAQYFTISQEEIGYVLTEGHATHQEAHKYARYMRSKGWNVIITVRAKNQRDYPLTASSQ